MVQNTELLQRAQREGTPIIDGEAATFVWEGETAPTLLGDFNGWGNPQKTIQQLEEHTPGIWSLTMQFPPEAYLEYAYFTDPADPDTRITDPLNKRKVGNGMGKQNSCFAMPGRKHTRLIRRGRGVPAGEITQHTLDQSHFLLYGEKRDLWLYQPPVEEKVPLLLVYDGRDYMRRAKLPQIVDNLIVQKRIRPVALAMIQNAGKGRFAEYFSNDGMLNTVTKGILPIAYQHLNLLSFNETPGVHGVLGASMGGLMALYTGVRLPQIFSGIISQSGAFDFHLTANTESILNLLIKTLPRVDLTIWQDVGRFEWLLNTNGEMRDLLREYGYKPMYYEHDGGHNYTSWRDLLPEALENLFGV